MLNFLNFFYLVEFHPNFIVVELELEPCDLVFKEEWVVGKILIGVD